MSSGAKAATRAGEPPELVGGPLLRQAYVKMCGPSVVVAGRVCVHPELCQELSFVCHHDG